MKKVLIYILFAGMLFIFNACNKKTHPGNTLNNASNSNTTSTATKPAPVKKIKTPIPKVIVVNDSVAKKTFDGRYYYDLEGHRYWRSNKDGKYYIYNKSMNSDPAFKKP